MKSTARRVVLETLGWLLVVAGIAGLFLPGPGLLAIVAGLALLAEEYAWADRHLQPLKERALRGAAESVENRTRVVISISVACTFIALGGLWIWSPPPPAWWVLDDHWWLLGGPVAGVTQVVSGFIALGLIAYSYRRFRT